MAATAYMAPPEPVSLLSLLENDPSDGPIIDLRWEPFQAHISAFLGAMDKYTLAGKQAIANMATEHNTQVRNITTDKEDTERRIQLERTREAEMLASLERERGTIAELTSSVNHLQASLARVREQSAKVEGELNAIKKEVAAVRNEKARQGNTLKEMRKRDMVELEMLEDALGWKVDGVGQDKLLMRFTLLDPAEPEREFSIVMDISKSEYKIPNCSPPLANLGELLSQLNTDRDLTTFIKKLRKSFKALIPAPQPAPSRFDNLSGPGLRGPTTKSVVSPNDTPPSEMALDALKLST